MLAFGILLYCGVEHFDVVIRAFRFVMGIAMPFLVGGSIAFILNVPMKWIEKRLFVRQKKLQKFRRVTAYLLTLICVIGILTLALLVVVPELGNTIGKLMEEIPVAVRAAQQWLADIPEQWPALEPAIEELNIDWASVSAAAVSFVQSAASGVLSSGMGFSPVS